MTKNLRRKLWRFLKQKVFKISEGHKIEGFAWIVRSLFFPIEHLKYRNRDYGFAFYDPTTDVFVMDKNISFSFEALEKIYFAAQAWGNGGLGLPPVWGQ